jgi:nucleolar protein 12
MKAALAKNNTMITLGGSDETITRRGTTKAASTKDVRLRVDTAEPTVDPRRSVFCGNLPYAADEESLQMHFVKGCGMLNSLDDVESVRIIRNPDTMQCRGFGYVRLRDYSMVALALQMHDSVYMKRNLRVFVCGKRFKGKRGKYEDNSKPLLGAARRREFEGRRATEPPANPNKRQKMSSSPNNNTLPSLPQQEKKRRTHSERNEARAKQTGTKAKPGVSKREASKVKLEKRVKKIQGRISKGMGKAKKF